MAGAETTERWIEGPNSHAVNLGLTVSPMALMTFSLFKWDYYLMRCLLWTWARARYAARVLSQKIAGPKRNLMRCCDLPTSLLSFSLSCPCTYRYNNYSVLVGIVRLSGLSAHAGCHLLCACHCGLSVSVFWECIQSNARYNLPRYVSLTVCACACLYHRGCS